MAEENTIKTDDNQDDDVKTWWSYTKKISDWNPKWWNSDDDSTITINHNWFDFVIQRYINEIYSELVQLVLNTESMDNDEKQYWFDIMPSMLDEQVDRLYDILETERVKLADLDAKYQEQIQAINQSHLTEWKEDEIRESKNKLKNAEKKESKWDPDDVLNMML